MLSRSFKIMAGILIPMILEAILLLEYLVHSTQAGSPQQRKSPITLVAPTAILSAADCDVIGEVLTSKTDWIRLRAGSWLEDYCAPVSFRRRTVFTYHSPSGILRRVEAERIVGQGQYEFAYWVMEGVTVIHQERSIACWACG